MIQSGVRERSAGANGSYPAGCRSNYEVARGKVAAARAILPFRALRVVDAESLGRAVEVYEVNRLDFADAYLVACADRSGVGNGAPASHATPPKRVMNGTLISTLMKSHHASHTGSGSVNRVKLARMVRFSAHPVCGTKFVILGPI